MNTKQYFLQLQQDAEKIASGAMKILASMQGKETLEVQKDEVDESTSADIKAEHYIIKEIRKKYPDHIIYSEEMGLLIGKEPFRWVIDPLDQTKEYVRGISEYNTLIAIEHKVDVVVGITLQHGNDNLYVGSKYNGSYLNGKRIHVSGQSNISNSFIGFNLPNRKMEKNDIRIANNILPSLIDTVYRVRPFWDQAKVMGWVARGVLDGNIAPPHVFKWHDIASSIILVEEAGGIVTDSDGNKVTEKTCQNGVIASNGKIHNKLLTIINKSKKGLI